VSDHTRRLWLNKEGRKEAREEGRKKKEEGRKEGRKEERKEGRKEGRKKRMDASCGLRELCRAFPLESSGRWVCSQAGRKAGRGSIDPSRERERERGREKNQRETKELRESEMISEGQDG